jgi:hypothetical protein
MKLTAEQVSAGWDTVEGQGEPDSPSVSPPSEYRMYEPLSEAAHSFVRWAQSPHERIHLGLPQIDAEMRGIAAGEMSMMIGYAHGGKTLLLLHSLLENRDKHIAMFIPDEPRQLILTKLTCMYHNIDARELERLVAMDDTDTIDLLRQTAEENFPNLAVFDQPLTALDMERGRYQTWLSLTTLTLLKQVKQCRTKQPSLNRSVVGTTYRCWCCTKHLAPRVLTA